MVLHKGFYYYFHVIHFWSLFALLFKKLKQLPWFLKKKEYLVSEIFPIETFLRCAADQMFIEVLLFKETSPGAPALKNSWLRA